MNEDLMNQIISQVRMRVMLHREQTRTVLTKLTQLR
jgi:hypothetical protein